MKLIIHAIMSKTLSARALRAGVYLIYLTLAVLAIVYLVFWRPFVSELEQENKPSRSVSHIDVKTMELLGWISPGKQSHFVHFETTKSEGTLRICALGDSNTEGAEVGRRHDYSSYLQRAFEAAGVRNVEVLNFGIGWYGFSQTYVMWDRVARRFGCDFLLVLPYAFWKERDTTFNHTDLRQPYYLHARYILEGGEAKRVDVIGDGHDERFRHYFRLIPHLQYLRYDRNAMPVLLSIIPRGRRVANWFYYESRSSKEEAFAIYPQLLEMMARSGVQIVIGFFGESALEALMSAVPNENVAVIRWPAASWFPYHAPIFHRSAWGHELRARSFFNLLVEGEEPPLSILTTSAANGGEKEPLGQPLSRFDSITLQLDQEIVGFFVPLDTRSQEGAIRFRSSLRGSAATALLAIKNRDVNLADACFVPLAERPAAGASIRLRAGWTWEARTQEIGRVEFPAPRVNIAVVSVDGVGCGRHGPVFLGKKFGLRPALAGAARYAIELEGEKILQGAPRDGVIGLSPPGGVLYRLRASGDHFAEVAEIPSTGVFDLVLEGGGVERVAVPLIRWRTAPWQEPISVHRPLLRGIALAGGVAEIVDLPGSSR